jgi:hypothetical protein
MTCILVSGQEAPPTILANDAADIEEIDDDDIVGDQNEIRAEADTVPALNVAANHDNPPAQKDAIVGDAAEILAVGETVPAQNNAGLRRSPRRSAPARPAGNTPAPAQNDAATRTSPRRAVVPAPPHPRRSPRKSVRPSKQTDFFGVTKENK